MNADHLSTLARIRDSYARRVDRLSRALDRHVIDIAPDLVIKTISDLQEARARFRALDSAITAAGGTTFKPKGQ